MMCTKIVLILCSILAGSANSTSTFDQRQTGELNIQVDLKNLHIIALMKGGKEEYVDYDYAYDYSEMTIKPQNGTTPRPLNGTSTASDIENATIATTLITDHTTLPTINISSTIVETEFTSNLSINESTTATNNLELITSTSEAANKTSTEVPLTSLKCKKGFVMNSKGDCELKLQNTGNALLKLVKLSQRLKLRRENRKHQVNSP